MELLAIDPKAVLIDPSTFATTEAPIEDLKEPSAVDAKLDTELPTEVTAE